MMAIREFIISLVSLFARKRSPALSGLRLNEVCEKPERISHHPAIDKAGEIPVAVRGALFFAMAAW